MGRRTGPSVGALIDWAFLRRKLSKNATGAG
jgi:hypothetical protein